MARSQGWASISYLCVGVNSGGVSVMWCRRQWYAVLSSGRHGKMRRLYLERTWVPSVRVGVTRKRRAIAWWEPSRLDQDHGHSRVQGGESGLRQRL